MSYAVLHIEDRRKITKLVTTALEEHDVKTIVARSTDSAWTVAREADYGMAIIDQKLPTEDDGSKWADEDEVYRLACMIGEKVPFVWLTGHVLSERQMSIKNCQGVIRKAGDVSTDVCVHVIDAFPELKPEIFFDEVMVELSAPTQETVTARVPTWRPDVEFQLALGPLESWVVTEVREAQTHRRYFRARAWLGAERPGELDLIEWQPMPQPHGKRDVTWDD